jgi:Raf kinase inhibitor-like YbhB/YbcL family protein
MQSVELKSGAFSQGDAVPKQYTGDGENISPPLAWSEPPEGTKSWALICDDPDAPMGTWVHWVVFNLPADERELAENQPRDEKLSNGAAQGKNDFGDLGYGGPAPPKGKPHRYFFKLYAVDTSIDLKPGATKAELLKALEGHVLGHGELVGTYQR